MKKMSYFDEKQTIRQILTFILDLTITTVIRQTLNSKMLFYHFRTRLWSSLGLLTLKRYVRIQEKDLKKQQIPSPHTERWHTFHSGV